MWPASAVKPPKTARMEFEGFTFDAKSGATTGTPRTTRNLDVSLDDIIKKERDERRQKAKERAGSKKDTKKKTEKRDSKGKKDDKKKSDSKSKSNKSDSPRWHEINVPERILRRMLEEAGVKAPSDKYELRLVAGRKP